MRSSILLFTTLAMIELLTSCHSHCDEAERVRGFKIEGAINKKYRMEWNHNSPEIDFSNHANNDHVKHLIGDNVNNIYLVFEKSGFWEYVQVGDSIVKKSESFNIAVFRNKVLVKKFSLDYGCPK